MEPPSDRPAEAAPPRAHRSWAPSLYVQVLVAIALGVLVGWLRPEWGVALKPLGDGFVKLAQALAVDLSWREELGLLLVLLLTSKGAAGVTGKRLRHARGDAREHRERARRRAHAPARNRSLHVRSACADEHGRQRSRHHRRSKWEQELDLDLAKRMLAAPPRARKAADLRYGFKLYSWAVPFDVPVA